MTSVNPEQAKWFIVTFHWLMAALSMLLALGLPAALLLGWQVIPWPWARWMAVGLAVLGLPALGCFAYRIIRRVRWLQGRGGYAEPILGQPNRARALIGTTGAIVLTLVGVCENGPVVWKMAVTVGGLFALSLGIAGTCWAWDASSSTEQERIESL